MREGVLYVAFGAKYLNEAEKSFLSLRKISKSVPVTLVTDGEPNNKFDNVIKVKVDNPTFKDKIYWMSKTEYDKTIFLDTDTFVAHNPIKDLFLLLDKFDFAIAHGPRRVRISQDIPDSFPQFNTGVIAYRKNDVTNVLFKKWVDNYDKLLVDCDQPSLRLTLYNSELKLYVLPPEYNYRTWIPGFVGAFSKVKILHGRNRNLDKIAEELNRTPNVVRVFLPSLNNKVWGFGITSKWGKVVARILRLFMNVMRTFRAK